MCGTLVVVVRGLCPRARARLYWALHAWPLFCGYAHDDDDDNDNDEDEKSCRNYALSFGGRAGAGEPQASSI